MKQELKCIIAAVVFYTRIPCPASIQLTDIHFKNSSRYFPLTGLIVGSIMGASFYVFHSILPLALSVILTMVTGFLITGAIHEDGWADVCDGFGGGWSKERILSIMKDPSIGVYGVLGIISILAIRFYSLTSIPPDELLVVLISSHPLSRSIAISFMYTHDYVRNDAQSKSKGVVSRLSGIDLLIAFFIGLVPMLLLLNNKYWFVIPLLFLTRWLLGMYFKKWIGGYTGDCLGATQQISEVMIYMFIVAAPWKYF